jgi:RsiW-degrading membrane proteinase PrsW (M82 family)
VGALPAGPFRSRRISISQEDAVATPSPALIARALEGSPLRRPLAGCFFWVALLLLLGIAFLGHASLWLSEPAGAIGVFVGSAAVATLVSLPALWFLRYLDRRERESLWLFGGAVLWGAVVATGVSGVFNSLGGAIIFDRLQAAGELEDAEGVAGILTAALVAPVVEETAKGLALLVLFWYFRAEFDNLRDGIIYGALVGLGFNIAETALYVMKGYVETDVAPLGVQLSVRFAFLGFNGHLLFSALVGAGLGISRQTPRRWLRIAAPVTGYALAVFAHALGNSVGVIVFALLLTGMGVDLEASFAALPVGSVWLASVVAALLVEGWAYLLLLALLALSARWERAVIRFYLADEVGAAVTPQEYASIRAAMPLLGTHEVAQRGGRTAQRIFNAQTELAFRKWHLLRDGRDATGDLLVSAWRQDIATLRQMAPAAPPAV